MYPIKVCLFKIKYLIFVRVICLCSLEWWDHGWTGTFCTVLRTELNHMTGTIQIVSFFSQSLPKTPLIILGIKVHQCLQCLLLCPDTSFWRSLQACFIITISHWRCFRRCCRYWNLIPETDTMSITSNARACICQFLIQCPWSRY